MPWHSLKEKGFAMSGSDVSDGSDTAPDIAEDHAIRLIGAYTDHITVATVKATPKAKPKGNAKATPLA